jgi:hypothetical protein
VNTGGPRGRAGRAAILLVLAWTAAVTILRGIRRPNDFAEAHWLLDYRFGFIRRGLLGEIVRSVANLFGAPVTESLIAALAAIVFALLWLALGFAVLRILVRARWSFDVVLAALTFLSSPFVVMSAHFMGYLDHAILLLSCAAIALLLRGQVVAGVAIQSVAVLVHESAIVVGVPAWVLAFWQIARRGGQPALRQFWPVLLPLAAFVIVAAADRAQHQDDLRERLSRRLARAEFVGGDMHVFVPEWLSESFPEHYAVHSLHFAERMTSAPMYGLALPSIVAILTVAVGRFRPRAPAIVLAIGVVVAPLVLHLAAFDTARIWTFTIVGAFVALWVLAETQPPAERDSVAVSVIGAAAIVANVMVTSPLMDGLSERFLMSTRLLLYLPLLAATLYLLRRRMSGRRPPGPGPLPGSSPWAARP